MGFGNLSLSQPWKNPTTMARSMMPLMRRSDFRMAEIFSRNDSDWSASSSEVEVRCRLRSGMGDQQLEVTGEGRGGMTKSKGTNDKGISKIQMTKWERDSGAVGIGGGAFKFGRDPKRRENAALQDAGAWAGRGLVSFDGLLAKAGTPNFGYAARIVSSIGKVEGGDKLAGENGPGVGGLGALAGGLAEGFAGG